MSTRHPKIRERIAGGRAQITGRFTTEEANDLALVLRSGSLPAPVKILEQRTVGPSLGEDSIRKGVISIIISAFVVVLFMVFYYKASGIVADVALILNIVLTLATPRYFPGNPHAPGHRGSCPVDRNGCRCQHSGPRTNQGRVEVGKTVRAAIDQGYHRAFVTIIDSNVTTLIAGIFCISLGQVR